MKVVFWGKGERGDKCLSALVEEGVGIKAVICDKLDIVAKHAAQFGLDVFVPEDPNCNETYEYLNKLAADLFVLAGYGKILKKRTVDIPRLMCINLHGGKLPECRGSSPMNWALINGREEFTLSIIKVDAGVDTGDILLEKTFIIEDAFTIRDLQDIANKEFPRMLVEVLKQINDGSHKLTKQDNSRAEYYPLRFPDDGFILWDMLTALQIHNRIRALTEPYPGAFTFCDQRKVKLLSSELQKQNYYGEPGKIYGKSKRGLLVCARDKCLWIKEARYEDNGQTIFDTVNRYDNFVTMHSFILTEFGKRDANRKV